MTRRRDKNRKNQPPPPPPEPRGLARPWKAIRTHVGVTISIIIAALSALFTGLSWLDQHEADAAAAYLAESHDASLVYVQLQQIPHNSIPQIVIVNDAHAPISNLTLFLPARLTGNGPSDGWHAYDFGSLPDMSECSEMVTNLMTIFKRDHLSDSAMGGAAITFRDVNGRYWTRLASGPFFMQQKPKSTAGLFPIPANLKKAPGCS